MDLRPALQCIAGALPNVQCVYLFGSRARGDELSESDLDLALLNDSPLAPVERWELQEAIAGLVHANVDLVDLHRASAVLRVQVLKDGQVILDRDPTARAFFEMHALSDYARLNEERREILADIRTRGNVYG